MAKLKDAIKLAMQAEDLEEEERKEAMLTLKSILEFFRTEINNEKD